MKKIITVLSLIVFLCVLCVRFVSAEQQEKALSKKEPALTKEERIFGLVTIYRAAKQHFAYFEQVPELDWDQAFVDFLPQVEKEQSLLEYYRTLQRFTALLQDGHTQVYLPQELKDQMDNLPIILDFVENQWVVIERWPTREIIEQDIPPGTVIVSFDGINTSEYFEKKVFPYIAHGTIQGKRSRVNWMNFFPKDTKLQVKLHYLDGDTKTRIIKANRKSVKWAPELKEKYLAKLRKGPDFLTKELESNCLYVRYRKCDSKCEDKFTSLIESFDSYVPPVIILDLRENGGGNTPHKTISYLISKKIPDRASKTRCSISCIDASIQMSSKMGVTEEQLLESLNEAKEKGELPRSYIPGWLVFDPGYIEPAEKHYKGQIIILVDVTTGSAAEDMAAKLKAAENVTIIGEPTNGSTGTPMFFGLPRGGQLRVCTINAPLSGVGVQPDIPVKRTIQGIAEGRDEVLDAVLEFTLNLIKTDKAKK